MGGPKEAPSALYSTTREAWLRITHCVILARFYHPMGIPHLLHPEFPPGRGSGGFRISPNSLRV